MIAGWTTWKWSYLVASGTNQRNNEFRWWAIWNKSADEFPVLRGFSIYKYLFLLGFWLFKAFNKPYQSIHPLIYLFRVLYFFRNLFTFSIFHSVYFYMWNAEQFCCITQIFLTTNEKLEWRWTYWSWNVIDNTSFIYW